MSDSAEKSARGKLLRNMAMVAVVVPATLVAGCAQQEPAPPPQPAVSEAPPPPPAPPPTGTGSGYWRTGLVSGPVRRKNPSLRSSTRSYRHREGIQAAVKHARKPRTPAPFRPVCPGGTSCPTVIARIVRV